jgi:Protein of unknown function (DUF1269)
MPGLLFFIPVLGLAVGAGLGALMGKLANADKTAAFTALLVRLEPPPLAELDRILARVLSDRFGLPVPRSAA